MVGDSKIREMRADDMDVSLLRSPSHHTQECFLQIWETSSFLRFYLHYVKEIRNLHPFPPE